MTSELDPFIDPTWLQATDRDYTCALCLNVVRSPMAFDTCPHIFCQTCLSHVKDQQCPTCRTVWKTSIPAQQAALELNSVKVVCPCDTWAGTVKKFFAEHAAQCPQQPRKCECGVHVINETMKTHRKTCPKTLKSCRYCGQDIARDQREAHKSDCPERIVECKMCSDTVTRKSIRLHTKFFCRERIVCPYCSIDTSRKNLMTHLSGSCAATLVMCADCLSVVKASNLDVHMQQCTGPSKAIRAEYELETPEGSGLWQPCTWIKASKNELLVSPVLPLAETDDPAWKSRKSKTLRLKIVR